MVTVRRIPVPPKPREEVFHLYWYFASERHAIFQRRVEGQDPPCTNDPILATFKFCNVFRASDRVSQFLIRDVAYAADAGSPADRLFQIVAFRTFSKIETWRGLRRILGRPPRIDDLRDRTLEVALDRLREENGGLYTGAFILCATDAFGRGLKHLNHVELFRHMFVHTNLAERLLEAASLEQVYQLLHEYPLMGDFMSYQTAIDLNYSDVLRSDFDENSFTKPGPGALRGIKKVFHDLGDFSPEQAIVWMVRRQQEEMSRRGFPFSGLWGRPLHAIDCQGLYCEVDKYCREALPALTSARKRIKARYVPHVEPITLFFPHKWGLNDKLPAAPVLGGPPQSQRTTHPSLFAHQPPAVRSISEGAAGADVRKSHIF
jgi:alpha-glutamyl/putrescinyl thymine pyrophosphorylase clade 1